MFPGAIEASPAPPAAYDSSMPSGHSNGRAGPAADRSASRTVYPDSVERLIVEFARLPGVGRRSAERLAFWVLKSPREDALALADAVAAVKRSIRHCSVCFNLTEADPCGICADPRRDRSLVLVVEQPKDLLALEQTAMHRGVYHVLLGRLSPLEGVGEADLTIAALLDRVENPALNSGAERVHEVILGLNPNLEGDGTALHLAALLRSRGVRVSRLARGLPTGGQLEYASKAVLADAIAGRQPMA